METIRYLCILNYTNCLILWLFHIFCLLSTSPRYNWNGVHIITLVAQDMLTMLKIFQDFINNKSPQTYETMSVSWKTTVTTNQKVHDRIKMGHTKSTLTTIQAMQPLANMAVQGL